MRLTMRPHVRTALLAAAALCVAAVPAAEAQTVDTRTRGGARLDVYVDGEYLRYHRDENQAAATCINALLAGALDCRYEESRIVDFFLEGATPPPDTTTVPSDTVVPPPPPPPSGSDTPVFDVVGDSLQLLHTGVAGFQICPSCGSYSPDPELVGGILRQSWEGVPDAYGPRYPYYTFNVSEEVYVRVTMRFGPDWDWGCGNGWTKWFTFLNGQGNAWFGAIGAGGSGATRGGACRTAEQRAQVGEWSFTDQWNAFRTSQADLTMTPHDQWFDLEMYINVRTGRVMASVDGEIVLDANSGVAGTPPPHELKLGSTLGGGSGLPTLDARYVAEYSFLEILGR